MTLQQLLTLATTTLSQMPHHEAVTPELLAAICWHESTGRPDARGDHDKKTGEWKALGLAQFHVATWKRFEMGAACKRHDREYTMRDCAHCSMRVLINELNHVVEKCKKSLTAPEATDLTAYFANFHNRGKAISRRTAYVLRVTRTIKSLAPAKPRRPASK